MGQRFQANAVAIDELGGFQALRRVEKALERGALVHVVPSSSSEKI